MQLSAVALACVVMAGCSSVGPVSIKPQDIQAVNQKDAQAMRKDVEPIAGPLTLNEALARALKYNLDCRSRMMEEALALGQLEVGKFDMLPKVMAMPEQLQQQSWRGQLVVHAHWSSPAARYVRQLVSVLVREFGF